MYMYLDLKGWRSFSVNLNFGCCRSQIAYTVNVDPEVQEKIQKRAERFKSSLIPQRSAATSILNSIHAMVRIATFWMFAISWLYFHVELFFLNFLYLFFQSFGEDREEMDWSKYHVVGTCEDLEKPYLRLTTVSSPTCLFFYLTHFVCSSILTDTKTLMPLRIILN